MIRLESFVQNRWQAGTAEGRPFVDPTRGSEIGRVDSTGIDLAAALAFARRDGGAALGAMSFAQRAALLGAVADVLAAHRADYAEIARRNSGNTARDAAIDIDGSIGTLKYYGRLGKTLGDASLIVEDGTDQLAKADTFKARHIWTRRPGVAVCINAFNFPAWGLWEKVASAFLAGAPVLAKPASATAWLAERMVRDVVAAGVLPPGVLSLVCGAADGLLDAVAPFDGIAFTGSSDTGAMIRAHARVIAAGPRLNIEADSVNVAVLGENAGTGSQAFALLVREVIGALSIKAGQLCTNIRRVLVPAPLARALADALAGEIDKIVAGDPADAEVGLGPLVNAAQRRAALGGLAVLAAETAPVRGGGVPRTLRGADGETGAFLAPTLLMAQDSSLAAVHETEVFGPVATLIPYASAQEAVALAARGGGSLAASVWCDDPAEAARLARDLAPSHGRVLAVDAVVGRSHSGHAIVMPQCVHGGPGRAGGGEELGGLRGLRFHLQRSAIQGSPAMLDALAAGAATAAL
jgi:3,4-dehydroadipyl-CoA semialdehyde dehydrogenase